MSTWEETPQIVFSLCKCAEERPQEDSKRGTSTNRKEGPRQWPTLLAPLSLTPSLQNLWESTCLLFKPLSLWCFVTAARVASCRGNGPLINLLSSYMCWIVRRSLGQSWNISSKCQPVNSPMSKITWALVLFVKWRFSSLFTLSLPVIMMMKGLMIYKL